MTADAKVCKCGVAITEWCWRAPNICLACYLQWKSGNVIVCSTGDVRVGDTMRGTLAHRMPAVQRLGGQDG